MTDVDQKTPDVRVELSLDGLGEPYIRVQVDMPEGYALNPQMADALGVQIIHASAMARAFAALYRSLVLGGLAPDRAREVARQQLGIGQ